MMSWIRSRISINKVNCGLIAGLCVSENSVWPLGCARLKHPDPTDLFLAHVEVLYHFLGLPWTTADNNQNDHIAYMSAFDELLYGLALSHKQREDQKESQNKRQEYIQPMILHKYNTWSLPPFFSDWFLETTLHLYICINIHSNINTIILFR